MWQLMRAYTLTILAQCTANGAQADSLTNDKEIIVWANEKLESSNKTGRIKSFQDSALADGTIIIDLIDAIKPGLINYELVQTSKDPEVIRLFCSINIK